MPVGPFHHRRDTEAAVQRAHGAVSGRRNVRSTPDQSQRATMPPSTLISVALKAIERQLVTSPANIVRSDEEIALTGVHCLPITGSVGMASAQDDRHIARPDRARRRSQTVTCGPLRQALRCHCVGQASLYCRLVAPGLCGCPVQSALPDFGRSRRTSHKPPDQIETGVQPTR
jgi:hypothetical protein